MQVNMPHVDTLSYAEGGFMPVLTQWIPVGQLGS